MIVLDNILLTIMTLTQKRRSTISSSNTRRSASPAEDEENLVGRGRQGQGFKSNPVSRTSSPFDASRYEKGSKSNVGSRASSPYDSTRFPLYDQPEDHDDSIAPVHPALRDNTFKLSHSRHSSYQNLSAAQPTRSRHSSFGPGPQRGRYDTLNSHSRESSPVPGFQRDSPRHSRHSSVDPSGRRGRYDMHDEYEEMAYGGLQP